MEQLLLQIIKAFILPPGLWVGTTALGLLCVWRGWLRVARVMLGFAILGTWWLSTWAGAAWVAMPLERPFIEDARLLNDQGALRTPFAEAEAIVVLGGGRDQDAPEYGADSVKEGTLMRVRYGAYLARASGLPLLVSGGVVRGDRVSEAALMAEALENSFGLRARWVEGASRNTAENAMRTAEMLRAAGITRVLLVTHANHMLRASRQFSALGIDVLPAPMRFINNLPRDARSGDATGGPDIGDFLPNPEAALLARNALHERIGLIWYRLRY
mgnify:CR=1 FL=1